MGTVLGVGKVRESTAALVVANRLQCVVNARVRSDRNATTKRRRSIRAATVVQWRSIFTTLPTVPRVLRFFRSCLLGDVQLRESLRCH
jgi:hypothetical protein